METVHNAWRKKQIPHQRFGENSNQKRCCVFQSHGNEYAHYVYSLDKVSAHIININGMNHINSSQRRCRRRYSFIPPPRAWQWHTKYGVRWQNRMVPNEFWLFFNHIMDVRIFIWLCGRDVLCWLAVLRCICVGRCLCCVSSGRAVCTFPLIYVRERNSLHTPVAPNICAHCSLAHTRWCSYARYYSICLLCIARAQALDY